MTSQPNERWMRAAIELALDGVRRGAGGPFGAVVVRDGAVLGSACNEVLATSDPTAHAEVVAIRRACAAAKSFSLQGCALFTSCEPCPMCLGAIYWSRIERVYFACTRADAAHAGFDDAFFYAELARAPGERKLRFEQSLRDEALVAFQTWTAKSDRTPY
ncbi:MAG: nucleoside deaminase [Planctomycetota bacterium]